MASLSCVASLSAELYGNAKVQTLGHGPLAHLTWLAGGWRGEEGAAIVEEWWSLPVSDTMFGIRQRYTGESSLNHLWMRIESKGDRSLLSVQFTAQTEAVVYTEVERSTERIAFENPSQVFPQRIEYWRAKDGSLHGRFSLLKASSSAQSREQRWVWLPL